MSLERPPLAGAVLLLARTRSATILLKLTSFRRTLVFLRPYRGWVAVAVFMTLLVTVLHIVPPRLFQYAIDHVVSPTQVDEGQSVERVLAIVCGVLFLVIAVRSYLSYLLSVTIALIGHRFCFDLRFATWQHLQRLSLAFHKQTQTGKIMSRATADIELIQSLIQGQLVVFLSDVITLFIVVGLLFFLEWKIAMVILLLIPFYVVSYMAFLKHIRTVREEQRRLYDEMVGRLAEKISGIAVVKAFVREKYETEKFMESVDAKFQVDRRQMHLNRRLGLISGIVSAVGTGVVYAMGGNLVQNGAMTIGTLVAITFYIGYVFQPAVRVVDFNTGLQWAVAAMDRVFETLDTRPEIEDAPNARTLPPFFDSIVLSGVTFGYQGEGSILKSIDLTIKAGEKIGVVGLSGAGKTTLFNLLMRFYDPTAGTIKIDGNDLRDLRMDSLRKQMSLVAQENVVFSASVAENVRYGNRDATQEQIEAACKIADLHSFVVSLKHGYETRIGERGVRFSGGQRQRLALARALVTDPRILLLDDVTSSLDGETEAKVQEALGVAMEGRTTLIVSHRLASVVSTDRIIVLDQGQIVDQGTHAELIEREGTYRRAFEEQFKSVLRN